MIAAVTVGGLAAAGAYLLLQRGLVRTVIGFMLLQHAVSILIVTIRAAPRSGVAVAPYEAAPADPVSHAFVLTAIVIGLGTTVFLLALALRYAAVHRDTDVEEGGA